jgi:hypothetical protein
MEARPDGEMRMRREEPEHESLEFTENITEQTLDDRLKVIVKVLGVLRSAKMYVEKESVVSKQIYDSYLQELKKMMNDQ